MKILAWLFFWPMKVGLSFGIQDDKADAVCVTLNALWLIIIGFSLGLLIAWIL